MSIIENNADILDLETALLAMDYMADGDPVDYAIESAERVIAETKDLPPITGAEALAYAQQKCAELTAKGMIGRRKDWRI